MTPSWLELVRVFGRIGLLSFGGPAAQIALMHRELVETRPWLDEQSFLRALSLCMLLPGPEAMQLATFAGWRLRGVAGGVVAGLLFVLPGAVLIAGLAVLYVTYGDQPLVQSAFLGIKSAVIVIVVQALHKLWTRALTSGSAFVIAGLAFVSIFFFSIPFPVIVAAAGLWGLVSASSMAAAASVPDQGRFRIGTVLFWSALWLGPLFWLSLRGPALLADLGWFFAKLAVVTFGGAYAVLAYMSQTVVDQYHWISTGQMIDALGLAETTPGPLILVTQFVAMLAGYLSEGLAMALAAGLVALWATFVPCFLWIFTAAPYLDRIAGRPRPAAALRAITAAVVGVMLNLCTWFALHVFFTEPGMARIGPMSFPLPIWSDFDPVAAVLAGGAAVWILLFRRGMGETLLLSSLAGLASHAL